MTRVTVFDLDGMRLIAETPSLIYPPPGSMLITAAHIGDAGAVSRDVKRHLDHSQPDIVVITSDDEEHEFVELVMTELSQSMYDGVVVVYAVTPAKGSARQKLSDLAIPARHIVAAEDLRERLGEIAEMLIDPVPKAATNIPDFH